MASPRYLSARSKARRHLRLRRVHELASNESPRIKLATVLCSSQPSQVRNPSEREFGYIIGEYNGDCVGTSARLIGNIIGNS
ncbi:hypothetical protein SORBI_3010G075300 [Sorghum bicolor]|uniref:Uncharacterized protein n=1 Tax=Sorghum bicolor TaxID=4558 RepID=A0A194YHV3_SORBI|nr:hypothetical protein SORBI_3010G075300 [Sorghum bicolor]